jgi:hypothetical protein
VSCNGSDPCPRDTDGIATSSARSAGRDHGGGQGAARRDLGWGARQAVRADPADADLPEHVELSDESQGTLVELFDAKEPA